MTVQSYENQPVDPTTPVDITKVSGKTVVITGGSSGLGLAYVHSLVKAGAFVVNGDINAPIEPLDSKSSVYVQCDATKWEDQTNLFRIAKEKSPSSEIDVVIANAGIYGPDVLAGLDDDEPTKPNTKLLDVNLLGVIYTAKLAGWYFHRQGRSDRCLILVSSIMGYIDTQGSSIYSASKHAVRGLMTCLRRKGLVRVNCLAPWFIATPILPDSFIQSTGSQLEAMGLGWATSEDSISAVTRLITDTSINGRTLGVVPRQLSPSGYMDLQRDDFEQGTPIDKLQTVASSLVYGQFGAST